MRKPSPENWRPFPEQRALSLFAQALAESLFDHTPDSFKAPAMDVHSLAQEALVMASEVIQERISAASIVPVLTELQERISSCPVLGVTKNHTLSEYKRNLNPETKDFRKIRATLHALLSELKGEYWKSVCSEIAQAIRSATPSRRLIQLVHTFICEAEIHGFMREDIYSRAISFFFKTKQPEAMCGPQAIDEFFKFFQIERKDTYSVTFFGERGFFEITDLCEKLGVSVSAISDGERKGRFVRALAGSRYDSKLVIDEISARDLSTARGKAEEYLQFAVDIRRFSTHQSGLSWNRVALVRPKSSGNQLTVRPPTSPVVRGAGPTSKYVRATEDQLVRVFTDKMFSESSTRVVYNVLQYHRAALEATTPENQLLDLWAAIEGLAPAPEKDSARIRFYLDQMLPALTLTYVEKLFEYTATCVREESPGAAAELDSIRELDTPVLRMAAVVVCDDLADERARLFAACADNPLLTLRLERLRDAFSTTESALQEIRRHRRWVEWQIQRIYSARNRISHSASRLPHLETLVENLHSYLDVIVSAIVLVGDRANSRLNIESAFQVLRVHEGGYLSELEGPSVQISMHNFPVLFGRQNALSPFAAGLI